MREPVRLPVINDDATKEEIKAAAEELLSLESDVDLKKELLNQSISEDRKVAG